jgi:hypothetical protein
MMTIPATETDFKNKQRYASITLQLEIHDRRAVARAATMKALESMTLSEWRKLRSGVGNTLEADIQMLLDPGVGPDGLSIEDSTVEIY